MCCYEVTNCIDEGDVREFGALKAPWDNHAQVSDPRIERRDGGCGPKNNRPDHKVRRIAADN
jgi:hypothetical protein